MSSANTTAGFISSTGFSSQCFPVRSLTRYKRQDDDGKLFIRSVFIEENVCVEDWLVWSFMCYSFSIMSMSGASYANYVI